MTTETTVNYPVHKISWHEDPMLGNDLEISNYTADVAR
jgi:hypothetical protein